MRRSSGGDELNSLGDGLSPFCIVGLMANICGVFETKKRFFCRFAIFALEWLYRPDGLTFRVPLPRIGSLVQGPAKKDVSQL
jgi:hypothetical protein